ncbi:hypothetical protein [Dyadobacter psychrotolerans]|uniref:Uncharacterized protein n=1 Tax=Dyadobacter psychrotolerans TaxID=2541721 RepID=A0A4R5DJ50_9BACT|nr:hypothetical protein [Dyadobacter psychrotolerans]TDE10563.1 hypothetical protein E0F88_28185 [Dyadobacter psychrotolerans]
MEFLSKIIKHRNCVIACFSLLLFLATGFYSAAQDMVRITTNVLPPYSPYIQDYPGTGNRVQVFISNLSGRALSVRLLGKLEGDNGVIIKTSSNYRPQQPLQLRPTDVNRLITRSELEGLFDLNQIEVQGMNKNLLYRGLPLPEGNYQLCVQAFDNATIRPLSAEFPMGCSGLIPMRVIEPPILIFPQADMQVNANTPQTQVFTWTAPVGILPNQVDYTLRIVELPALDIDPNVFIDAVVLPKSGLEVKNLKLTTFLYGPQHPPLQVGKRYAWRVQAVPVNGKLNFLNDGKSPVQAFTYGQFQKIILPGIEVVQNIIPISLLPVDTTSTPKKTALFAKLPANCSCKVPVNESEKVDNSQVLKTRKATIAGFQLDLLANVKEEKGALSGTGMIPVPMINNSYVKLRVNLFDIQCNAQGQVISGFARAIYKEGAPGFTPGYDQPEMPALEMTPATMQNLSTFFSTAKDQLVSSLTNSAKSVGFELPLGIDKTFGPVNTVIAITNMTFMPNQAFFDANTWVKTANSLVSGIPLSGFNMCFTPEKLCGEGVLYLADKMQLSPFFALKGAEGAPMGENFMGPDTAQVTHVVFDDKGFKQMRVHGLLTPPGLTDAATKGPVEISVNTGLVNFQNWTAQLSFPKFYVNGLSDFKFSMQEGKPAIYDHSEMTTPAKLPEGYLAGPEINLWQGLYFPEINLELPAFIKRSDGKPLTVGVQDMISDNNGFSGKAFMKNILDIGDGSLASWYYSIDELSVSFLKSTFQNSAMSGKIVLPVFKDPTQGSSQLPYSCTLSKEEQSGGLTVQFTAKPTDEMSVDIWRAKLKLEGSSYVSVTYSGNEGVEAKAVLNGGIDIDAEYFTIPGAKFEELTLTSKAPYFGLKSLKMGFASPQKLMDDFPLTLTSADLVVDPSDPERFGFKFAGKLDLTGGEGAGLTADAGATLFFKTGLSKGRPNWSFDDVTPDKVSVDAPLGPVQVKGSLEFYNNDGVYGNGLNGTVKMTISGLLGGDVSARFGRTTPGQGGFRYWYVGGKISIGASGIPFAPPSPLVFRSFGGGLYSKVTRKTNPQGEVYYTPDDKTGMGFEALVGVGLVTPGVLTMEGTLGMEMTANSGIGKMSFHVDAWLLGDTKSAAFAKGSGDMVYDFQNKIFDAQLDLAAGYSLPGVSITAEVKSTKLHVDGAGLWFLSLGIPQDRIGLKIDIASLASFKFGTYFMLGNYNGSGSTLPPAPYGFDKRPGILQELGYKSNTPTAFKDGSPLIAFGSGYSLNSDFGVGPFHLRFDGAVGFDLALSQSSDLCNGKTPGINGWYAMGQIYAYMHFALDLDIDTWVYEGTFTVVELEAAALLRGGMVNPIWLNGHVLLKYRVLGGLVKGKVNLDFWYNKGERCEPAFAPPNPFAGQPLIAAVGPSGTDKKTSILSPYYAEFNYPVQSDLIIDLEVPQGQKVEAGTQGTTSVAPNGNTILHREFQLLYKKGFSTVATKVDPQYAGCDSDNSGRYSYDRNENGDPNYNVTFYRYSALLPKSSYKVSLDLQVHIRNNGKLEPYIFKNQTVEQTESVEFQTGDCITVLSKGSSDDDAILSSYPYEGQRYFMKGEDAVTFIRLKTKMTCCLTNLNSDANYDLMARFTPLEGTTFADDKPLSVMTAKAVFTGDQVNYTLPAGIKNKTFYRFELVRIPKPAFVNQQLAEAKKAKESAKKISTANIYVAVNQGFNSLNGQAWKSGYKSPFPGAGSGAAASVNAKYNNTVDTYTEVSNETYEKIAQGYGTSYKITAGSEMLYNTGSLIVKINENAAKAKEEAKLAKKLEVSLYKYYFKTSQFNKLSEKVMAAQFPLTETNAIAKMMDALTTKMESQEGFDSYEMQSEFLGNGTFRPSMVLLKAGKESFWFKTVAIPIAEMLERIPSHFYEEADLTKPFGDKNEAIDLFRRSMVQFNHIYDDIQKPFKNEDIYNLIYTERKHK